MSLWKCNACGGTYSDLQRDGSVYMHACAPTPPNAQGISTERANKRDENVVIDRNGNPLGLVSVGAGVTPMQGQPTADPAWIVKVNAAIAAS